MTDKDRIERLVKVLRVAAEMDPVSEHIEDLDVVVITKSLWNTLTPVMTDAAITLDALYRKNRILTELLCMPIVKEVDNG